MNGFVCGQCKDHVTDPRNQFEHRHEFRSVHDQSSGPRVKSGLYVCRMCAQSLAEELRGSGDLDLMQAIRNVKAVFPGSFVVQGELL